MTDEEFFTTLTALRDHAKTRRREEFSAGKNEEEFGEWDSLYSTLDGILVRRTMEQALTRLEKRKKRSGPTDPA